MKCSHLEYPDYMIKSKIFLLLSVYVCVWVCSFTCMHVYMGVEVRGFPWSIHHPITHHVFWDGVCHWTHGLPDWWASEHHPSCCPSSHMLPLEVVCSTAVPGLYGLLLTWTSYSCLHIKHFTDRCLPSPAHTIVSCCRFWEAFEVIYLFMVIKILQK